MKQGSLIALGYFQRDVGFAAYLAWFYCSFFTLVFIPTGQPPLTLLLYGGISASFVVVTLIAIRAAFKSTGAIKPFFVYLGSLSASAGSIITWTSLLGASHIGAVFIVGVMLTGIGEAALMMAWAIRLSSSGDSSVERICTASFAIGFAVCIVCQSMHHSIIVIVIAALLPMLSAIWYSREPSGRDAAGEALATQPGNGGSAPPVGKRPADTPAGSEDLPADASAGSFRHCMQSDVCAGFVLFGATWFVTSYLRCAYSLNIPFDKVPWPFITYLASAFLVMLLILLLGLRRIRSFDFSLTFRWALPLLLFSYAFWIAADANPIIEMVALTLQFISEMTLQLWFWITVSEFVGRNNGNVIKIFSGFLIMQGIGVAGGLLLAVGLQGLGGASLLTTAMPFLIAFLVAFAMGTTPRVVAVFGHHSHRADLAVEPDEIPASFNQIIDMQADGLAEQYHLSQREKEVARLLLAGRSRPFIRDELSISLNTVNVHVRNIFEKCGVHSHQELLDLVRRY